VGPRTGSMMRFSKLAPDIYERYIPQGWECLSLLLRDKLAIEAVSPRCHACFRGQLRCQMVDRRRARSGSVTAMVNSSHMHHSRTGGWRPRRIPAWTVSSGTCH